MAVTSIYLYQLVHDLARSLNDLWPPGLGTPAATFSTTSFTCTALMKAIDDFFNGWDIHFHAGTHKGQSRECTDYSSAYAVTFAPAVTGSVDATDLFAMFKRFNYEEYKSAINRAIRSGNDVYLFNKIDETVTLVADTWEYSVPSGFRYLTRITMEDEDGEYPERNRIDDRAWRLLPATALTGTPTIKFDERRTGMLEAAYTLRLEGQQLQAELSSDSDVCYMPSEFILTMAKAIMLENDKQIDDAGKFRGVAQAEKDRMRVLARGRSCFEV